MKLNTTACLTSLAALATAFPHSTVTAKPSTTRRAEVVGDGRLFTLPDSKNPRARSAEQPPPVFGDAGPVIVSGLPEVVEERDDGDDEYDEYDGHGDGRDDPLGEDAQEDDEELKRVKCLIPEGCVVELAPGVVTSLTAGEPVPTLPPNRASSTRAPAPTTTTAKHHHLPPILRRPPPSRHTLDHADEAPAPTDGPEVGAE
ncbi:hypothetical protein VM1G_10149 [Cytospora mali]|uniref:Uncharacterized protein n=1 Tax=Cytospora mali TaxID=578113 RepID=A0A194WDL5_CYTMA|nr:hypothetical protein VM1G_10149 [Valsa mali]